VSCALNNFLFTALFRLLHLAPYSIPLLNLSAFFNGSTECEDLFKNLLVSFLHFFYDLKRSMFLAENFEVFISNQVSFLLNFHEVPRPSRTFNVEGNLTFAMLALNTSSLFL